MAAALAEDVTLGFQMQQFLDEWHYRVMHSGMVYTTDRIKCVRMALDLFDAHGVELAEGEKDDLAQLDDQVLIKEIIKRMPAEAKRSFEYFTLQLQLVVSAATRVRGALEEVKFMKPYGDVEVWRAKREVAECLENDTGICQQILRETILEATSEVHELNEMHDTWWKDMGSRVGRLVRCSDESEKAQSKISAVQAQLDSFSNEQNQKSRTVLLAMTASSDKSCMEAAWKAWLGLYARYKAEQDIHDKFRKQIDDAQQKLLDYKAGNKKGVKHVLLRNVADHDRMLTQESFRTWQRAVAEQKEEVALQGHMEQAKEKLAKFQEKQVANTKKVMLRMTAGRDSQVLAVTFQAWQKGMEALKKEAILEEAAKVAQKQIAEHLAKKSADAKQVINRMLGTGEQGLLIAIRGAWNELYKQEKREQELDEAVQNANKKMSEMSAKQKRVVKNASERINALEEEIVVHFIFQQWLTQAKLDRVYRHYTGKMDVKKHQLEAVQNMFKSFASQLEQGISTTPRSQRTKRTTSQPRGQAAESRHVAESRPPDLPPQLPPQPPPQPPMEP